MYMAIAQEDRHPIVEIMEQTPEIPESAQWAIFLRNHDELTLEMVTSRERDYMYKMYAADPRARLNLGIRRRLAPLMENDPDRIKLMNSLLLSMPGAPIIYYGDEIGMGDNFFLGDRNGVRTPMQWSPDRNAGFSRADPQQLYLPPIMDPIYGYEAVNVEAQRRDRSSLLNWMKRMLQVRQTSHAFGRGTLRFIRPGNRKVLVYLRELGEDVILCVANLSRSAQPVELDLSAYKTAVPLELLGRTPFPPIGDLPYFLTLPNYGFYWFKLSRDVQPPAWHEEHLPRDDLPVLVLIDGWKSLFPERVATWRATAATKLRTQFEERVLPRFISTQRWYAGKGAPIERARLVDQGEMDGAGGNWFFAIFDIQSEGASAPYFLPLTMVFEGSEDARWNKVQAAAIARVRQQATVGVLAEATGDETFSRTLIDAIGAGRELSLEQGTVRFWATPAYAELRGDAADSLTTAPPRNQGSNTTLRAGDRLFLKVYRRLQNGVNPEVEIGRMLTEVAHFPNIVPLAGAVEYHGKDGTSYTLALLQSFVMNQGDGWDYTVDYLVRFLEDRRTGTKLLEDVHGAYLALMRVLGERTAQLHCALAFASKDPAFVPEPITAKDLGSWKESVLSELNDTLQLLAASLQTIPENLRAEALQLQERRDALAQRISHCVERAPGGLKTRYHGDYHLGQVLLKRNDFVIVDFEGEPARPLAERRAKHSPLRDVAGMFRSFAYAREVAQQRCTSQSAEDCARWSSLLAEWEALARQALFESYDAIARKRGVYSSLSEAHSLLELFEIEKALYELRYELRNRPAWTSIPLRALLSSDARQ
jgi:maltose alpha-D-glucosyltransferase/alpha-amylase